MAGPAQDRHSLFHIKTQQYARDAESAGFPRRVTDGRLGSAIASAVPRTDEASTRMISWLFTDEL
jgi:hypothetical protein